MCGGFCLHKWMSNSKEVLQSVDENRDVGVFELELDNCPIQRTLGMKWNVKEDTFVFSPHLKSMPHTKRGVVSIVSSIFDPFGLISPFILRGKCIMQELWRRGIEWDEVIPEDVQVSWIQWLSEVEQLSQLKIPRHHISFSSSNSAELHMFSDASEKAFSAVAYLRYEIDNDIKCSFLASKTRVAPLKPMLSIPRLELQAAILSVRLWDLISKELDLKISKSVFWTDSTTVLWYIKNKSKRFKPFVSNRIAEILEHTTSEQWRYVPSEMNTSDYCTRGLKSTSFTLPHPWFTGPSFLQTNEDNWPRNIDVSEYQVKPELCKPKDVMHVQCSTNSVHDKPFKDISKCIDFNRYSSFQKLTRVTAWFLRAVNNFCSAIKQFKFTRVKNEGLSSDECKDAEYLLAQQAQEEKYGFEIDQIKAGKPVHQKNSLLPLTPIYI